MKTSGAMGEWIGNRKADGRVKPLAEWPGGEEHKDSLRMNRFELGAIAAGSTLGWLGLRFSDHP